MGVRRQERKDNGKQGIHWRGKGTSLLCVGVGRGEWCRTPLGDYNPACWVWFSLPTPTGSCFSASSHSIAPRTGLLSHFSPPRFSHHLSPLPWERAVPRAEVSLLSSSGKSASCEQFFLAASGHLHPVLLRLMCENKFRVAWGFLTSSQGSWGCRARGHILHSKTLVWL